MSEQNDLVPTGSAAGGSLTPSSSQPPAKPVAAPQPGLTADEDRDEFIRSALPVASALRKAGKPAEAKQLEQAAQAIWQTKSMQPTAGPTPGPPVVSAPDAAVKDVLANVWKAIEQDPALKNMPEAKSLRRAGDRLDKAGLLSITVRNGVVVSFVSNFTDNLARTQQLARPAVPAPAATLPTTRAPAAPKDAPAAPAALQAYPAYTSYAPSTESGIVESRKVVSQAREQLNVGITDQGAFGINPQVNQQRLIGDGISMLVKFFDYELPTSGLNIAHVGLAEPGQMKKTPEGWEVVTKGKLALTDSAGNVFAPKRVAVPTEAPTPAAGVVRQAPAPLAAASPVPAVPAPAFDRSELPAELLARMGVPVEELERAGQLQKLLTGQKTDLLQGVKLPEPTAEAPAFAAKLVLDRDAQGVVSLRLDLPQRELEMPAQVMGKLLTPLMREQLQTSGVTPLAEGFRDSQGRAFAGYLAVDYEMKRVVVVRPEGITLPKEVYGVTLTPQQRRLLLEGRPARIEGMTNGAKQLVDAVVQLDPLNRKLLFRDTRPRFPQEVVVSPPPLRRPGVHV